MNRRIFLLLVVIWGVPIACSQSAKSDKSIDQIRELVIGKTEAEVERLLGEPDYREILPFGNERWTWWNYTYLGGKRWAPEVRNRVVHLEITFAAPFITSVGTQGRLTWKVSEPYGVGYSFPDDGKAPSQSLDGNIRGRV